MKYLLVLVVVMVGVWMLLRSRGRERDEAPPRRKDPRKAPADMVACAHCDLRLPRAEALFDAQGRPFCDAEHRRAGPR